MAESFNFDGAWRLNPKVALRPEPFGALAYHYGTRRLSFLKDPLLVDVVSRLEEHDSAREVCLRAGVGPERLGAFSRALARIAESGMIEEREVT